MLTIILNIIGLLFIIVSLVIINKISKEEKSLYEEIVLIYQDIKYYSHSVENLIKSFDDLIGNSLNKFETLQKDNSKVVGGEDSKDVVHNEYNNWEENNKNLLEGITKEDIGDVEIKDKIFELKQLGFSNEEIAKRLNKGVREVDIIIKMWSNIYKNY
ncbi:DUF6115 domain-containing protein [Clostridium sp. Cult2]|uniref:DUF6115 domain-containing protein n=1 Tax=Clostridium sp. Cult2 TaxID=2079003 RepID=UPI001F4620D8|nr:hypothetical protein [Clostridium sp. Cult2]MCF6464708.1 hypothetical protein [Clostridium sp. Cult2]